MSSARAISCTLGLLFSFCLQPLSFAILMCPSGPDDTYLHVPSHTLLRTLTNATFDDIITTCSSVANVTTLTTRYNNIERVNDEAFSAFPDLEKLDLSHNVITVIAEYAFDCLHSLKILDLSFNQLTTVQAEWMINKVSIESVNFDNNIISKVDPDFVDGNFSRLRLVSMRYNRFDVFEPWPGKLTWYPRQHGVRTVFDLRYNNISKYAKNDENVGQYTEGIKINLQYNNITTFDILQNTVNSSLSFGQLVRFLHTFDIKFNPFFCDCKLYNVVSLLRKYGLIRSSTGYTCHGPDNLDGMDMRLSVPLDSLVCDIHKDCPSGCRCERIPHTQTTYVDCSGVGLSEMPKKLPDNEDTKYSLVFDNNNIRTLKSVPYANATSLLSLNNNKIDSIEAGALKALKDLDHLFLRNNRLRHVPVEFMLFRFEEVDLTGNSLVCDCNVMWMSGWIQISRRRTNATLVCYHNNGDTMLVENAKSDATLCAGGPSKKDLMIVAVTSVCVVLALALLLSILFRNKIQKCFEKVVKRSRVNKYKQGDKVVELSNC